MCSSGLSGAAYQSLMTTPPTGSAEDSGMKLSVSSVARQRKLLTPSWGWFGVGLGAERNGWNKVRPLLVLVLVEISSLARREPQPTTSKAQTASTRIRM